MKYATHGKGHDLEGTVVMAASTLLEDLAPRVSTSVVDLAFLTHIEKGFRIQLNRDAPEGWELPELVAGTMIAVEPCDTLGGTAWMVAGMFPSDEAEEILTNGI